MPLQLGDQNPTVRQWRHVMNARFGGLYTRLHGPLGDTDQYGPRAVSWQQEYQRRTQQVNVDGVVSDNDLRALGIAVGAPVCVYFSVCGTGVPWNVGYCWDIGEALDKTRCYHQPIGYPAAGPPSAMQPSINAGVVELIRQMDVHRCDVTPWCGGGYSQGAIVWMTVLMRVMSGDLGRFKATYMGSIAFGNPMREAGHSFPGCVPVPGQGIVQPNAVNTPAAHWDFSDVKTMVNSPGDDFYTTMDGEPDDSAAAADSRAVWDIIANGLGGVLSLAEACAKLALSPSFSGGYGAAEAIFYALDFFVVQSISPHTAYSIVQPIVGDQRDCWAIALAHIRDLVASLPVSAR